MRLLLDTHALVWWVTKPGYLADRAFNAIGSGDNQIVVSAVSAYEIEYKRSKASGFEGFPIDVTGYVQSIGFEWLSITPEHTRHAAQFRSRHRDPWDRILAAQSIIERLDIITVDDRIRDLGASVLW